MVQGDIISHSTIERLSIQRNAALLLRCSFRCFNGSIFGLQVDSKRASDSRCGSITISQATRRINKFPYNRKPAITLEVVAASNKPAIAHCAPWSTVTSG
ncbi:unnamed protein product [Musa textilis]